MRMKSAILRKKQKFGNDGLKAFLHLLKETEQENLRLECFKSLD